MPTISSRPQAGSLNPLPSTHALGDIVSFWPTCLTNSLQFGVHCKVVRISFDAGKVLYDLALPDDQGAFYDVYPIRLVDSYFVRALTP
jgi:hypothetical protein